jgi:hypothetical protein
LIQKIKLKSRQIQLAIKLFQGTFFGIACTLTRSSEKNDSMYGTVKPKLLILALTPSSPPIYPHTIFILHTPKSHKKTLPAMALTTLGLEGFQQNQALASLSICGDEAYTLGWGLIKPQAIVGAKAARHHGDTCLPH